MRKTCVRALRVCVLGWVMGVLSWSYASAQDPAAHQHEAHVTSGAEPESTASAQGSGGMLFSVSQGSGTSLLPDESPMFGVFTTARGWQLMLHGNAFVQAIADGGERGHQQGGSINWVMGMARRPLAGGTVGLRSMVSLEPWTVPGCGYPDLLATGETCDGASLFDRQHPHDLFMELAAEYARPLAGSWQWSVYGGPAAEPALGPVAFPHRLSAMANPLAPISHHWLDATHIAFGVVTGGASNARWKAEASVFNGREPDEARANLEAAAMDSVSGRVWFRPSPRLSLQVSAGRLAEAEAGHDSEGRVDVNRLTASATWHRALSANGLFAATLAWGRNTEEGESSHALLAESTLHLRDRDVWFGRAEVGGKPAHDLGVEGLQGTMTVAKLQGGYTRMFAGWRGLRPGLGGSLSAAVVPTRVESVYGGRVSLGGAVFFTLRSPSHRM